MRRAGWRSTGAETWLDMVLLPLAGRRILVTRAAHQAAPLREALEVRGAEVMELPCLRIATARPIGPLRRAVERVGTFDWLILTSVHGVQAFFAELTRRGKDARALAGVRICAIGPATAGDLACRGIRADLVPAEHVSEGIVAAFARRRIRGLRFLLARSDKARPILARALRTRGARVTEVDAYRTVPVSDPVGPRWPGRRIDWFTFTSGEALDAFLTRLGEPAARRLLRRGHLATIGPATTAAARRKKLSVAAEADPHTIAGLVRALILAEQRGVET